jgi:DNA-binding transcriptional MerR regulator
VTALPDRQFFKIGEAAEIVGVKTHVLRYWETEFPSIKPLKTRGAHRMYRRADVELLCVIHKLLHHEGYTIAGARKRVRELRAELRRTGQSAAATPASTQAAGASAFGVPAKSAAQSPGASGNDALAAAERASSPPETTREFSLLKEDTCASSALRDADSGLGMMTGNTRELGVWSAGARGLGQSGEDSREQDLWKEASRELELRAELIQLRRELCDLTRELDRLSASKPIAVHTSATVTAVVPKTVLIAQRKPLR